MQKRKEFRLVFSESQVNDGVAKKAQPVLQDFPGVVRVNWAPSVSSVTEEVPGALYRFGTKAAQATICAGADFDLEALRDRLTTEGIVPEQMEAVEQGRAYGYC